jgi:uncharacterized protein (TIGR00661 family)
MKIFYAVQATGNGHISRAMRLLPMLRKYGQVDIFLSGANSQLTLEAPVRYRSNGVCLFYNQGGGLDYWKIIKTINPVHVWDEVKELPVENYDVVINDFECITSLACAYKKVPSVNMGHQASFRSPYVPLPKQKDIVGKLVLNYYARATQYIGFHFEEYDDFIFEPVIKKEVLRAKPVNKNHITVYLSAYGDEILFGYLNKIKHFQFHVFSKQVKECVTRENVTFMPVNDRLFTESMITSDGVITGAGFETPAEALHLQKKLMVIPIRGQYEQYCNAAALERLGVTVIKKIGDDFAMVFEKWRQEDNQQPVWYGDVAPKAVDHLFESYPYKSAWPDVVQPTLIF